MSIRLKVTNASFLAILAAGVLASPLPSLANQPANLSDNNLFTNPGFDGASCYEGWEPQVQTEAGTICGAGEGVVWLNHNNQAGDPAVQQTVTNLDPSKTYVLEWSWRIGDTAHLYVKNLPQPIFAVSIDGAQTPFSPRSAERQLQTDTMTFSPQGTQATIAFQGEAGNLDGDVVLDWVSLREEKVNPLPTSFNMITYGVFGQVRSGNAADDFFVTSEGDKAVIKKGQPRTLRVERADGSVMIRDEENRYLSIDGNAASANDRNLPYRSVFTSDINKAAKFKEVGAKVPACAEGQQSTKQELCLGQDEAQTFVSLAFDAASNQGLGVKDGTYLLRHSSYNLGLVSTQQLQGGAADQVLLGDVSWRIQPN